MPMPMTQIEAVAGAGAGLSVGDLHFSQGDGEITFCGAIEMPGWIHLRISSLIKGGSRSSPSTSIRAPATRVRWCLRGPTC